MKTLLSLTILFLFSQVSLGMTNKDSIKVEIRDSLLFINNEFVPDSSMVEFFNNHFGKPDRKKRGLRYKWHRYIYDDLGISIMTHPNSVSVSFTFYNFIRIEPKSAFKGVIIINGHLIDLRYSFDEIEKILSPCKFTNLFDRSLLGAFFSFERGLSHELLSEINYSFVQNKKKRLSYLKE